jgi:hypothetical protein
MLALVVMGLLTGALADNASFVEGQKLYEESEYEQSIFRLQAAALDPTLTPSERAQVFVWLGLAYAGFGDATSARRAFHDGLALDGSLALPVEVSPKVEAEFAAVQAQLADEARVKAAPKPAPPVAPPPPPSSKSSAVPFIGLAVGGLGVVAVIGGGFAAVLALQNDAIVKDLDTFQDDAAKAQSARDAETVVAAMALPVGVLLVGGGIAVFALTE